MFSKESLTSDQRGNLKPETYYAFGNVTFILIVLRSTNYYWRLDPERVAPSGEWYKVDETRITVSNNEEAYGHTTNFRELLLFIH